MPIDINNVLKDAATVVFLGVALALGFSAWRSHQQAALRKALLDKFGSAQDLGAFLQSAGGQRFLADLSGVASPLAPVLGSIQKGILALLLGIGIVVAGLAVSSKELAALGMIFGFVGVGFLCSAAITYVISKRCGLFEKPTPNDVSTYLER